MALSVAPSESFDGNDGPWSSFWVNIGTPPQQMLTLPATSESAIFVVLPEGCPYPKYPGNCADLRGQLFQSNLSKYGDVSWTPLEDPQGDAYLQIPFKSEESLPNYSAAAQVGLDTVNLTWIGDHAPTAALQNLTVGAYAAPNPWLGMLGLNGRPSHVEDFASIENSLLQNLRDNKVIHSLYWAYTAGQPYLDPRIFGSLSFGGYDALRTDMPKALQVNMSSDSTRDLLVTLKSITISGQSTTPVSGLPISILIDSVVPEIWLPQQACAAFETALGLTWNDTMQYYFVNETQRSNLLTTNPSVTFTLTAYSGSLSSTTITLPYRAFDLQLQAPLAGITDNVTSLGYFPLKRAENSTQYFLGRTFLQEAYIAADYDRQSFTVSPVIVPTTPSATELKVVFPPSYHKSLSTGAIAGIAVGAVAIVALIAGLAFWYWWSQRKQKRLKQRQSTAYSMRTASLDNTTLAGVASELGDTDRDRTEWYKPSRAQSPGPEGTFTTKAELDATNTAIGMTAYHAYRHELDAGSVRPAHHSRNLSEVSAGSAGSGVSPMGDPRVTSMLGEPSPPLLAHPSPPLHASGSSSPPLTGRPFRLRHQSGSSFRETFEME